MLLKSASQKSESVGATMTIKTSKILKINRVEKMHKPILRIVN